MTALRCTQKLLTAVKLAPSAPPSPGANRLGDWSLNLLHTRPKLVVAVSEHDRFGLVLEAAPYATLPQRLVKAIFAQVLAIGVPPGAARGASTLGRAPHLQNPTRGMVLPLFLTAA